ncbi:MAG TPA: hypothetical protein VGQ31_09845 [Candidatus Limnocylindrales bacterium]|nr:hypothetical protein [Candidatus Limnocylindrales bacterium]
MSIWARPLLVGLLAIGVLATAGATVAAPQPRHPAAAGPVPAPVGRSAPIAAAPAAPSTPLVVGPSRPAALTSGAAQAAALRPQVATAAKTVSAAPKAHVAASKPKAVAKPKTASYHGTYHLWIPALGLSHQIYDWGCNGGLIPNRVEYWGCVGRNNLYLLGHAWGVFKPVHDGYHSGALHVGLTAWYADKAGVTHRYRISWIRHVANKDYASWSQWAMAVTSTKVITLQTCDGATSAYRILVRLVPA